LNLQSEYDKFHCRSKILLIQPYAFLRKQYNENDRYAIYDEKSIAYWSEGVRQYMQIGYPETISSDIDLEKIRNKINWNMPLWLRWMGQADRYEDYRQTCLLFVIRLMQALLQLNVKSVLFFTGVAHHIEMSLIESACQMSSARQIYLYPMPFFTEQNRLLPLVQNDSIRDRRIVSVEISNKDARDAVVAYRENHLAARPPQLNEKIDSVATSYPHALMRVVIFGLKTIAKTVLRKDEDAVWHPIDRRRDYNFLSILRIVQYQKNALDYYLSTMLDEYTLDQIVETEGGMPILYAHYQPEASTFPEGGDYANHLDVVISMRKLGYFGKILYKEHPGSWIYYSNAFGFSRVGLCRSVEYYRQLAALGCVFVPPSYKLSERHLQQLFPITITGSVGVERSLVGLATCCAGVPWFKGAPGIFDLATTFGEDGVFYDQQRWQFDPMQGVEWFAQTLSKRTINNYPGIGTGVALDTASERAAFLEELDALLKQFNESEVTA
jgi:hypothetical protein